MYTYFSDYLENAFHSFKRPMQEVDGWYAFEKEGKVWLVINALGVDEKDVDISVDATEVSGKQRISVKGTSENKMLGKTFSVKMDFLVYKPIKEIVKSFENGLLILEIEFVEPVKPLVNIRSK